MKIVLSLEVKDFVYQFYQKGAKVLQKRAEELMEQALFMYSGMVAQDMIQDGDAPKDAL